MIGRAGLDEGGGDVGARPGGAAVGDRGGGLANAVGLGRDRLRQRSHDLAERAADEAGRIVGVVVAVEDRHHQAQGLGRAEHQRRQAKAAPDAVAAVGAAHGFDRDAGLAKDGDVAAGGALGHTQLVGQPVGGDAGAGLQEFECQQGPCGRARIRFHDRRPFRTWIVRNPP